MKKVIYIFGAGLTGFVLAWFFVSQQSAETLRRAQTLWENEKASLLEALARAKPPAPVPPSVVEKKEIVRVREEINPHEIIQRLQQIKIAAGPGQIKNTRLVIQQLENLITAGPSALPALREFLLRHEEIDYDSSIGPKGSRDGKIPTEFMLPPSLRFGLFDAARQIGGSAAEKLLAEILGSTGRGAEVAYLARVLQEMAPNQYRELSVQAARDLLSRPATASGPGLDKYDREYLYGVLAFFGDASFVGEAQTQLVRADGAIDRGALKYLQHTLGPQALPSIAKTYTDPTLDPSKREPLARYALTFAGADAQATAFWHQAVTDPTFPLHDRRELIEDLNQDGIQNEDHPTKNDAQLIANRLQLIDQFYNENDLPAIRDAWKEAQKDLRNMLANYQTNSAPK